MKPITKQDTPIRIARRLPSRFLYKNGLYKANARSKDMAATVRVIMVIKDLSNKGANVARNHIKL